MSEPTLLFRKLTAEEAKAHHTRTYIHVLCVSCDQLVKDNALARSSHGKMHVRRQEAVERYLNMRSVYYVTTPEQERQKAREQAITAARTAAGKLFSTELRHAVAAELNAEREVLRLERNPHADRAALDAAIATLRTTAATTKDVKRRQWEAMDDAEVRAESHLDAVLT